GYTLTYEHAKQWAELRYPDADLSNEVANPHVINKCLQREKASSICRSVLWPRPGDNISCMFITQFRTTTVESPYHYRRHKETDGSKRLKQELFGEYEERLPFLKETPFATVPDPHMRLIDELEARRDRYIEYLRERYGDSS
ncbi:hypothetical protein B0H21DRAFT_692651, partial [Amylocystis lapponica]